MSSVRYWSPTSTPYQNPHGELGIEVLGEAGPGLTLLGVDLTAEGVFWDLSAAANTVQLRVTVPPTGASICWHVQEPYFGLQAIPGSDKAITVSSSYIDFWRPDNPETFCLHCSADENERYSHVAVVPSGKSVWFRNEVGNIGKIDVQEGGVERFPVSSSSGASLLYNTAEAARRHYLKPIDDYRVLSVGGLRSLCYGIYEAEQ